MLRDEKSTQNICFSICYAHVCLDMEVNFNRHSCISFDTVGWAVRLLFFTGCVSHYFDGECVLSSC
jgi:hypothetical protein